MQRTAFWVHTAGGRRIATNIKRVFRKNTIHGEEGLLRVLAQRGEDDVIGRRIKEGMITYSQVVVNLNFLIQVLLHFFHLRPFHDLAVNRRYLLNIVNILARPVSVLVALPHLSVSRSL